MKNLNDIELKYIENVYWNVMGEGALRLGLLPERAEIPKEFWDEQNPYNKFTSLVFFEGSKENPLIPKSGISDQDKKKAMLWWKALLQSFEPEHNHKIAGCAYLLSLWFDIKE